VHLDRAVAGETAPLDVIASRLRAVGVHGVAPNGVLGDPSGATAAEGDAILAKLTDDLTRAVDMWLDGRS
jgi:creatinine amidohydrolase/Fe(II)-dependent formamide hydrolase-like protein